LLLLLPLGNDPRATTSIAAVRSGREDIVRSVRLPGTIAPWEEVVLAARVSGYVTRLPVDRGDRVGAGDTIAEISVPEMAGEIQHAKAELERAQAGLALQTTLLAQAKAAHDADPGSVSEQEIAIAESQARIAAADTGAAEGELARLEALDGLATVRAPFAGVIVHRDISPGALVRANDPSAPIATLVESGRLRAIVDVPETDAAGVAPGHGAKVTIRATGRVIEAKVTRVAGSIDPTTRTLRTEIDVDNADGSIRPGSYADFVLELETRSGAVVVPEAAVLVGKNSSVVFVLDHEGGGYVARRREVVTGVSAGRRVEIVKGLEPGELLVAVGTSASDGQRFDEITGEASR